ncbi:MAG: WbqC family protein, partial [Paeniclostridium sp.]
LINAVDQYVIYDDVSFIKGGWINRNRILINNEPKLFNIQMQGASPNKLINEIEVSANDIWKKKLLKTIQNSYSKATFYKDVYPILENIINYDEKNLSRYLENSIKEICKYLNIDTNIVVSSSINKNNDLKAQDKVIEICKILGASEYYNSIGGEALYSKTDFKNQNLELKFLRTKDIEYKQFNDDFTSNLSIIDVMMFNSVESIKLKLNDYDLV